MQTVQHSFDTIESKAMTNRSEKDVAAIKSKLKKGVRVICRIDKDEWYTGTINEVSDCVEIVFDDGSKSVAADDELNFIKRMHTNRVSKTALTFDQAEPLFRKHMTRVVYDAKAEQSNALSLVDERKPWVAVKENLSLVSSLVPFNELLTIDYRSPVHEYSLGMAGPHTDKLTSAAVSSMIKTAGDAVERFAKACGMTVQRAEDSRLAISNPHIRQRIRIKVGAFKDGRSYVQVAPI